MDVLLLKEVENLGYKDDIVSVKPGYGRNFLIPQGMAKLATPGIKKGAAERKKQQELKHEKMMMEYQKLADKMSEERITVGAKTGTSGKIFGSVTTLQLADAVEFATGTKLDRKKIKIQGGDIKSLGTYTAEIELHRDMKVEVEFEVVAE